MHAHPTLLRVLRILGYMLVCLGLFVLAHFFGTDVALYVALGAALSLVVGYAAWERARGPRP